MRNIAAQMLSLLLLSQIVVSAHGIRILEKESLVALMQHILPETVENREGIRSTIIERVLLHKSDEKGRGATKESTGTARKPEQSHEHMIPSFHEDYYGPRDHKPKHH